MQAKQTSFLSLVKAKRILRKERFLLEMDRVIPWEQMLNVISEYYYPTKETVVGRKKKELMMMIKIYFLQQWYNLSDPLMEEEIYETASFQKFLDIDLLADIVPDETTILRFRHFLEQHNLTDKLFDIVNKLLEERGLILKKGTIVDATIIETDRNRKNPDQDMSSTKKNNNFHYGAKAHIGVDADSGAVHTVEVTTAKMADNKKMEDLMHGEERALFGDKGYISKAKKKEFRKKGLFWGILDKGNKYHHLSSSQEKRNKKLSSIRSKVEHPFRIVKYLWKHDKFRYRGLTKFKHQMNTLFALANLYMFRKKLAD